MTFTFALNSFSPSPFIRQILDKEADFCGSSSRNYREIAVIEMKNTKGPERIRIALFCLPLPV